MTVEINDVNLTAFLEDPAGGISIYMKDVVVPPLLELARLTISRPFPGHGPRGTRFPPPGPPYLRTGLLKDSLTVVAVPGPSGQEYDIVPTAIRRGYNYGNILKGRGYHFLPASYYI